jgi:hypothetical protein
MRQAGVQQSSRVEGATALVSEARHGVICCEEDDGVGEDNAFQGFPAF